MRSACVLIVIGGAVLCAGILSAAFLSLARADSAAASRAASAPANPARVKELQAVADKLRPLATRLGKSGPDDWLAHHAEAGQTFQEYAACDPVTPRPPRTVLYVQPLGEFSKTQRKIVMLTADFMGRHFGLPVKVRKDLPLSIIPAESRRKHPMWGMEQLLTGSVLSALKSRLPDDAAACIAFTTSDLWPGEGWNFVFGEASLTDRVGVWSIYRNGDPYDSEEAFRLCLLRTIKTATHETGHMFSMQHCTMYECNMCGSNNREESDRRPLALCPECLAKVCYATGVEPREHLRKLAEFCKQNGLTAEEAAYNKQLAALEK
jgi:archaemetzincin